MAMLRGLDLLDIELWNWAAVEVEYMDLELGVVYNSAGLSW